MSSELTGPSVVGTGLLGTSVALASNARASRSCSPTSPRARPHRVRPRRRTRRARDRRQLIVSPSRPTTWRGRSRRRSRRRVAIVTDVGSVKAAPLPEVAGRVEPRPGPVRRDPPDGGQGAVGPLAASAELFDGRPWVITPTRDGETDAVALVAELVAPVRGRPETRMAPDEHDRAVARASHLPTCRRPRRRPTAPTRPPSTSPSPARGPRRHQDRGLRPRAVASDPRRQAGAVADLLGEMPPQLDELISAVRRRRSRRRWRRMLGAGGPLRWPCRASTAVPCAL